MKEYFYKCTNCNSQYSSNEIEENFIYLCPKCGKAEKNKPLEGVLLIEYDYESLKKNIDKKHFDKIQPGKCWLYPELLPLKYSTANSQTTFDNINPQFFERLALPNSRIREYKIDNSLISVFDDTRNPTLSFKDRASILVALKALQMGINEISAASTGNAGSSIAGICASLGMHAHVFVPSNIPDSKRIQIQSYGADIYMVDGSYDTAFDLCLEVSDKKHWYNRNTAYNPLTIEGKKSAAYDIYLETKGKLPENLIVPVGDGVIIAGLYKGFDELCRLGLIERVPKLIAAQAEGSDALVRYLDKGKFEFRSAETVADSISAGAPRNLYLASKAIKDSKGYAIAVSDNEILEAQKSIIQQTGIFVEPSSAVTYTAFKKIRTSKPYSENEKFMLMLTGHGLKDVSSLQNWNLEIKPKSANEWKVFLKI